MAIRIQAQRYRALTKLNWTLAPGVHVLVGPNGAGKTTVFRALELLKHCYLKSPGEAVALDGGANGLQTLGADERGPLVALALDSWQWALGLAPAGSGLAGVPVEILSQGEETRLGRNDGELTYVVGDESRLGDHRTVLRTAIEAGIDVGAQPLVDLLTSLRVYPYWMAPGFDLEALRRNGSALDTVTELDPAGRNVFAVLRNWRDQRKTRWQYQWVIDRLKAAFPGIFDDMEFESAGMTVAARFFAPGQASSLPHYLAANGLLTALLFLVAVAGIAEGGLVALDEPETSLHPFAIRSLLEACRDIAERKKLTIIVATHSPVVLNDFQKEPERVFVLQRNAEQQPVAVSELGDADWLASFSLGDLYQHGEFGGQAAGTGR